MVDDGLSIWFCSAARAAAASMDTEAAELALCDVPAEDLESGDARAVAAALRLVQPELFHLLDQVCEQGGLLADDYVVEILQAHAPELDQVRAQLRDARARGMRRRQLRSE